MASVLKAPPLWQDEKLAKLCPKCNGVFNLTNRKHHCRFCGKIYCKKCSSNSAPIPLYGIAEPVRVCDPCWDQNFSAKAAPKPMYASFFCVKSISSLPASVSPIRIYYKTLCREFDRNNVSLQSLGESFGATLSMASSFDAKRGPFHLVKRDTKEQFFYLGPGAPFWRILPQGEYDLLSDDQYQVQQRRRTLAMDVCMPDPPAGNTSPAATRGGGSRVDRGNNAPPAGDEFSNEMAAMMADLEREEEQKRRGSSPRRPMGPRKDAGRLAIGSRDEYSRLSSGPTIAPPPIPDEPPATFPMPVIATPPASVGTMKPASPRSPRDKAALQPKTAVSNHISDIKEIVGIMKDGNADKDAMRNQVKQVVQRRKTVMMQEAALVAAPIAVQEKLAPKREAIAQSRKSRKTLLLSANADMETLAAEEEDFARIERELQEEEERLLREEEERVRAEFENLQRMESELASVAVSTGTSSASIERRKTRTVTMLLPPGDIPTMEGRPAGGRSRGESVAQRTRTTGEVKEQIRRGTVRMSVKPRRETILELEGIIATERERRRTMTPQDLRTKSVRMNDMLDEQELMMLAEEVRLLREEEDIERQELARLQKEEELVKEAERLFREEEAAFLAELAAEEERLYKEMLDEDARLRDEEEKAALAEEALIAAEEERLRLEEEALLAAEEAALAKAQQEAEDRAAQAAAAAAPAPAPALTAKPAAPRLAPKTAPVVAVVPVTPPAGGDASKYRFVEPPPVIVAPTVTGVVKMPAKAPANPITSPVLKQPATAHTATTSPPTVTATPTVPATASAAASTAATPAPVNPVPTGAIKVNRFPSGHAPSAPAPSPPAATTPTVAPTPAPATLTPATGKPPAVARGLSAPTLGAAPTPPGATAAAPTTAAPAAKLQPRVMPKIAPPPPPPDEEPVIPETPAVPAETPKVSPRPGGAVSPRGPITPVAAPAPATAAPAATPPLTQTLSAPKLEAAWVRRPSPQKVQAERSDSPNTHTLAPTPVPPPTVAPAPAPVTNPAPVTAPVSTPAPATVTKGSKLAALGAAPMPKPPAEPASPPATSPSVSPVLGTSPSPAPLVRPVAKPIAITAKPVAKPAAAPAASPNSAAAFLAAVDSGNASTLSRTSGQGPMVRKLPDGMPAVFAAPAPVPAPSVQLGVRAPVVATPKPEPAPAPAITVAAPAPTPTPAVAATGKAVFAANLAGKLAMGGPPPKALTPASDGGGSSGPASKLQLTPLDLEDFQNPNNAGEAPAPRLPMKPAGPAGRKPPTRNIAALD